MPEFSQVAIVVFLFFVFLCAVALFCISASISKLSDSMSRIADAIKSKNSNDEDSKKQRQ
ncbi:MAG: hypothetical protein K2H53_06150 [Clostridia bacterium]|nr:hypothetical protein [Clostridia bacterium]